MKKKGQGGGRTRGRVVNDTIALYANGKELWVVIPHLLVVVVFPRGGGGDSAWQRSYSN